MGAHSVKMLTRKHKARLPLPAGEANRQDVLLRDPMTSQLNEPNSGRREQKLGSLSRSLSVMKSQENLTVS